MKTSPLTFPSQDITAAQERKALPERAFGRDGVLLPVLGLGGQSLVQRSDDDERPVALISKALDLGVRYIDTAPIYGPSELRVGLAIDGRRHEAFLATKTLYRRASSARQSLERSLIRLRTDYVDLLQLHCFMDRSEIGAVFARGGVMKMIDKAREEGIVKRVGITGHFDPDLLAELLDRYPFDSVLMPVNPADPARRSFLSETLNAAHRTGASVVAMKVMGAGLLTYKGLDPARLLRYALSQPVSVAVVSCRSIRDLEKNVETAARFEPYSASEMRAMESESPSLLEECNAIYKRSAGKRGLRLAVRNWLAAQATKMLPGWWHL